MKILKKFFDKIVVDLYNQNLVYRRLYYKSTYPESILILEKSRHRPSISLLRVTLNLSTRKQFPRSSTRSRRIEEKVLLIAAFQRAEAVSTFTLRAKIPRGRGYDILLAIHRFRILLAKNLSFKIYIRLNILDSLGSSKRFNVYNVG